MMAPGDRPGGGSGSPRPVGRGTTARPEHPRNPTAVYAVQEGAELAGDWGPAGRPCNRPSRGTYAVRRTCPWTRSQWRPGCRTSRYQGVADGGSQRVRNSVEFNATASQVPDSQYQTAPRGAPPGRSGLSRVGLRPGREPPRLRAPDRFAQPIQTLRRELRCRPAVGACTCRRLAQPRQADFKA
jgi:hypothetical protein